MKLPSRFDTLTGRLILLVLGASVLVWLAFAVALHYELRKQTSEHQSEQLEAYADLLWQGFDDEDDAPKLMTRKLDKHLPLAYALYRRDGSLLAASSRPALPRVVSSGRKARFAGETWMIAVRQDDERQLVLGESLHRQEEVVDDISEWLGPLAMAALLLLLPLLAWAIYRGLKPLRAVSEAIAERAPDNLEAIDLPVPREIAPLLRRLNALFDRVATALARERRFTADAAHELRTPLAALGVQLEIARDSPRPQARERALVQMQAGLDRSTRLLTQLLELARLDEARLPMGEAAERFDLPELARHALQEAGLADDAAHLSVRDPLPCRGHAALIGVLLRNLLDNARRYAGTEANVRIAIAGRTLTVSDDGPGVDTEGLARLGERFFRPPGQRQPGAGLGLSIARRIAELHRARLRFGNRNPHGFEVSMSFSG